MTAVLTTPTPGQLAANVALMRDAAPARVIVRAVDLVDLTDAVARDRARNVDCGGGRHDFAPIPGRAAVCRHCPIPQDQAARVRAAFVARHAR